MVSQKPSTPSVQQKPHKPIRFTAGQVALMAKLANEFSPEFCQRATPHLTRPFLGFYLETLVSDESPAVPPAIQRALNLQQNRKGDFTWKAA